MHYQEDTADLQENTVYHSGNPDNFTLYTAFVVGNVISIDTKTYSCFQEYCEEMKDWWSFILDASCKLQKLTSIDAEIMGLDSVTNSLKLMLLNEPDQEFLFIIDGKATLFCAEIEAENGDSLYEIEINATPEHVLRSSNRVKFFDKAVFRKKVLKREQTPVYLEGWVLEKRPSLLKFLTPKESI